jgi:hypothetical protein
MKKLMAMFTSALASTLCFLIIIIGPWVFCSWQEAKSFNKFSIKQASVWDAMFVQLRVTTFN